MTAGAPGGSRISTAVLQVILNVIDFGMNVQDAVDAPRVPPSVAARQAVARARHLARHGRAAQEPRLRRRLRAGRRARAGRRDRQRRRMAAGRRRTAARPPARRQGTEPADGCIGARGRNIRPRRTNRCCCDDLRRFPFGLATATDVDPRESHADSDDNHRPEHHGASLRVGLSTAIAVPSGSSRRANASISF